MFFHLCKSLSTSSFQEANKIISFLRNVIAKFKNQISFLTNNFAMLCIEIIYVASDNTMNYMKIF